MLDTITDFLYEVFVDKMLNTGGADTLDLLINDDMLGMSKELWKYLAILAMGLTIMYFLLDINQKFLYEGRDVTMKTFLIPFCKLFMAIVLLQNGATIVSNILGYYNATIREVDSWVESGSMLKEASGADEPDTSMTDEEKTAMESDKQKIRNAMSGMGLLQLIGILPVVFIMWIIQLVLKLFWKYKALTFQLELLWRVGVSPLAFSDVYSGQNSNAIRWIKSFIATAIYGASFILIVRMGASMATGDFSKAFLEMLNAEEGGIVHGFASLIKFIVIPFAELGILGAVKQTTKEAFG